MQFPVSFKMAAVFLTAVSFLMIGSTASGQEGCDFPLELGSGDLSVQLSFDPKISCWAEGGSLADRYVDAQGSGSTTLTLSALFSGTLIPDGATLLSREITFEAASADSPNYQGGDIVFSFAAGDEASPATASGKIDFSKIYNPDNGWAMFGVGFQIKVTDTYQDSEGTEHTTSQNFSSSFRLYAYRKVNVRVSTVPRGVGVGIQEIIREPNGAIVFRGIPGYWVDLTAAGQYIQFANSYPTTNEIGWAEFPFSIPLSSFPEGGQLSDTLIVDAGEEGIFTDIPVTAYFAYITESRGEVFVNSGESWRPALVGETLPKGTVLKFGGISPEPPSFSPRVVLRFGDGKEAVVETYSDHTRDLAFTLGDSYIQGQTGTVLMNGTIPMYDPNYSYWKWGKLALRGAISAGSWLTPLGWQARAGIIVVNLGMAAMDWWGPGANAGPHSLGTGPSLPPEYQTSSLLEVSTDLMGDGSLVLQNRGVAVKVETDNGQSAILPAGTQMILSASSGLLSGVSALPRGTETGVAIQLTPSDGGSAAGATPEILIDYPDAWSNPIIPESLTCRVNGVLVSPALTVGATASRYAVPPERQLRAGANILKAALTTQGGVRTRAESHFTAPDTAPAAPKNVAAYAGRERILLRWSPNREADLAGYRVYRAANPTDPGTELTTGLLAETIFVDPAPSGSGYYYVKALDAAGQAGPESIRLNTALNPKAALVTPPEPTGFSTEAGDREVVFSFDDGIIPALGWRLLRSGSAGGPYSEIALIARSGYRDKSVTNGQSYYYRLVPAGYDLTEGTWAQAGPVTPSDLPPAPPRGLTAEMEEDQLTLEWDPSPEPDLAGYYVYRAAYGQSFVKINASPLPVPTWTETMTRNSLFQYRVTAVDQTGHESAPGLKVETAGRRADMQHIVGVLQGPGGYISGGGSYTYGSSVSLTAQADPGYYFDHWTGEIDGNTNPYQFTVTDDLFVSALFSLTPLPGTLPAPTLAGSGSSGFQDGTGTGATFNFPNGVAVDTTGNIYVADTYNYRIRKITPGGVVTTLAGSGSPGSQDGNGAAASFRVPTSLAVDAGGYVYVTDTENHRIRKISPGGQVTTLAGSAQGCSDGQGPAASFFFPIGIAVDGGGNIYVADTFCRMIRKISPDGLVSTIKEGFNIVFFNQPRGIAVTPNSDLLFVADTENHQIKKLTPAGAVTLLAGSGIPGNQDGTGSSASFHFPRGLARDSLGNLYVADQNNHRVRKITPAGVVTTLAGSVAGFQEGGTAMFDTPASVAVDSLSNVYVADSSNHAIRKITTQGMSVLIPSSGNSLTFQTSTITTTLNFQAGSVGEATSLYLRPGAPSLSAAQFLGSSTFSLLEFNLYALTGGGVPVNQLQAPYTITIHYSDWDVRGMDENSLTIYRREGGLWVPLATTVDADHNIVSAQTTWLGDFKVAGLLENHLLFLPLILR